MLSILVMACASDNEEDLFGETNCGEEEVSLADDIQPIINANCAIPGCHGGNQSPNLESAQGIIGNAARIRAVTQGGVMPPANSGKDLTEAQIQAIACWVDNGAQNN
ncbi:c-type cytochrome [Catalinimonas niigatensis]|uniref:c-type cytochrome n=1 Tax=Catalinimonas niigatensis TaxID=1397264 RepID=UPI00266634E0|nr:c-type cytochrome [Catalinimonas niigatensis]WPP49332.1 c-type cytochrome [Catalinimonas niigatensis]